MTLHEICHEPFKLFSTHCPWELVSQEKDMKTGEIKVKLEDPLCGGVCCGRVVSILMIVAVLASLTEGANSSPMAQTRHLSS